METIEEMQQPSVLLSKYVEPSRPYSQKELRSMRHKNLKKLKVSREKVTHSDSKFFYFCKRFGKKEKEILQRKTDNIENYNVDVGNCSVSWKLRRSQEDLQDTAYRMVSDYMYHFKTFDKDTRLDYYMVDLEKVFYTWLYLEN